MRFDLPAAVRILLIVFSGVVLLAITVWGFLALYFTAGNNATWRLILSVIFGLLGVGALIGLPARHQTWGKVALVCFILGFAMVLVWWSRLKPSNSEDWQPDVARLSTATIDGDLVTIHNIRNLDYRTDTDFTLRYYDKTYDLRELRTVDLISAYWMGPTIAHVFLSFGFAGRDYLAISIEMRKERGQTYSAVKGFFRQYELYYVVADERDVIRVRTNFRNPEEQVYLYRTNIAADDARILFLNYIDSINKLAEQPEFYNALTSNCTTNILLHTRGFPNRINYHWKIILSGYADEYLYEVGGLDSKLPFDELKRRSLINPLAHKAKDADDFSLKIRENLPLS